MLRGLDAMRLVVPGRGRRANVRKDCFDTVAQAAARYFVRRRGGCERERGFDEGGFSGLGGDGGGVGGHFCGGAF